VDRVRLLEPLDTLESKVEQSCLVIGGGISGMACANRLAEMGYNVHLVDRNKELGGKAKLLNRAYMSTTKPAEQLNELAIKILANEKINTHLNSEITGMDGFIGQFEIDITESGVDKQFRVGTIVLATGAQELKPKGILMYGENPKVVTHLDLENMINSGTLDLKDDAIVSMISCVGAKEKDPEEAKVYCCNIGCANIVKNTQAITLLKPGAKVQIFHKDWTLPHKFDEKGRLELEKLDNIEFVRYSDDTHPTMASDLSVSVINADTGELTNLQSDLVVLTTPPVASEGNTKLKEQLGVCLEPNGFFMGALGKLKPPV